MVIRFAQAKGLYLVSLSYYILTFNTEVIAWVGKTQCLLFLTRSQQSRSYESKIRCIETLNTAPKANRAQKLCESRGGRPGLPVTNSPCGLCGRKATLNLNSKGKKLINLKGLTAQRCPSIKFSQFQIQLLLIEICCPGRSHPR